MFSLRQLKELSYFFINQFFDKYFFVISFLISIQIVIFFAPGLGLGDKDDFFLYKNFGVFRSTAFIYSFFFLAVLLILRSVPYFSRNITEFWRRWHMSMSNFIGTYIYKPYVRLTNNKRLGIFIAFIFAGLWHEISLRFIFWGIGHGLCMALTIKNSSKRNNTDQCNGNC